MFLLIDKPRGITSHDVVTRIRRITGEKKIGHGGTLDPNATGLLIIGVGRESTKRLSEFSDKSDKKYEALIFLGEERDTDDAEGTKATKPKSQISNNNKITISKIKNILVSFLGEQEQVPPIYSAIKIKGKKAYELARRGRKFQLKPRRVNIYDIRLIEYKYPYLRVFVRVSSGTYIRALARDIGRKLGVGAYLLSLRRIGISKLSVDTAVDLDSLNEDNWRDYIVSL